MNSEPILELADLEDEPTEGFEGRVRRSILRRVLVSDLSGYVWFAPLRIALEYLGVLLTLCGVSTTEGDGEA